MEKVKDLGDAKIKLKEVTKKLKIFRKALGIPRRSRNSAILKRIIAKRGKFKTRNIEINGRYIKPDQLIVFELIKSEAFLKGYITAKMNK